MDGRIDILTIVLLVVAVVIILKLRSALGRRTGDEQTRLERYKTREREAATTAATRDKVVTLPTRNRPEGATAAPASDSTAEVETRLRARGGGEGTALANAFVDIWRVDRGFEPDQFLTGAKQAYEMIVIAFAEGNRRSLRDLLSRDVYDGFITAVGDRESRGEVIEQSFVGLNSADIVEAELKAGMAHVTVKFVSELISATRDRAGTVIAGDPKRIKEVTDIWTFAREAPSRNPNWKLVATQAAN